jgi:hypothetical protein
MEVTTMMMPKLPNVSLEPLPPSCLGPDGKLPRMNDEERGKRLESVRQRFAEIGQMTDEDPPGTFEEFMRGLDKGRPHRPMFKGYY